MRRLAQAVTPLESSLGVQALFNETSGPLRGVEIPRVAEHLVTARERPQHETVPGGDHLVVLEGAGPLVAPREQPGAKLSHGGLVPHRPGDFVGEVKNVATPVAGLERPLPRNPIHPDGFREFPRAQGVLQFLVGPDVERAFLALAVGILGGIEPPFGRGEVFQDIIEHAGGHLPVEGLACRLRRLQIHHRQKRLRVKHLLKMRHAPGAVGGVAMESAADMVMQAAARHGRKRRLHHGPRAGVAGAPGDAKQRSKLGRRRKLAVNPEAAVNPIKTGAQGAVKFFKNCLVENRRPGWRWSAGLQIRHHPPSGGGDLFGFLLPALAQGGQQPLQFIGGKVGTAEKRHALGRHHHGHGPAAATGHRLHHAHIQLVDGGQFLAVHLDADESLIQ